MSDLFSDQLRLLLLIVACAILWSVESVTPLFLQEKRFRHSRPNIALAVILIVTNLAFSFVTATMSALTVKNGLGILLLVEMPLWLLTLLGVASLDRFTSFAHVVLHNT